ncbi:MAG: hypothetical protein KF802_02265 [Bdellovibrionaceae bacterium]|nr:hypothetical protein [Pseudobdellovibrionaceae bacterium]
MTEIKVPKKRGRKAKDQDRLKAVLLRKTAPQLMTQIIYPKSKNNSANKFIVQIIHPNTKKVLWEKTYGAKTPIARMRVEANERLKRLQGDVQNKTWVDGMEKFDKTLPQTKVKK